MMLVHKGLPQWQFKFTPIGLTPWAEVNYGINADRFDLMLENYIFSAILCVISTAVVAKWN